MMRTLINRQNKNRRLLLLSVVVFVILTPGLAKGKTRSELDVRLAVTTWVRQVTADAKPDAVIEQMEPSVVNGQTVAYIAHLKGGGYCLCGCNDLVLPVYLYSPKGQFDPTNPGLQYILWEIGARTEYLTSASISRDPALEGYQQTLTERPIFWQQLVEGKVYRRTATVEHNEAEPDMMVINFTPKWHQRNPYNFRCPAGDTSCPDCCPGDPHGPCPPRDPTVVGCTATAAVQIMKYWWWPHRGTDSHSYDWDGDDSCPANGNPGAGAQQLSATFSDTYDWANMANQYRPDGSGGWLDENGNPLTQVHLDAVSELCYEVAVSIEMDFGRCGSGCPLGHLVAILNNGALEEYFYYDYDGKPLSGTDIDAMTAEIQWLRPFGMGGCEEEDPPAKCHAFVVYGYNKATDPSRQFLMNMGWGPGNDDAVWYSCSSVHYKYEQEIAIQLAPESAVRFVGPERYPPYDGSPSNAYPTFAHALGDEDLPDGTVLIFKAGTVHTLGYPAVINKPLLLRGHEVIIH